MAETWDNQPEKLTRRGLLVGLGSTAAFVGYSAHLYNEHEAETSNVSNENEVPDEVPTPEAVPVPTSEFLNELAGYSQLLSLRGDEVLFVDENNVPIAPPVKIQPMYGEDPGVVNKHGLPIEGIRGQWLDAAREALKFAYPDIAYDPEHDIPKQYNVVAQFRAALDQIDEPELVAGIEAGTIETYRDIVAYFADKPVRGAEHMTRMKYVENEIRFKSNVPTVVQEQLRRIMPALCIQESGFNNDLQNRVSGARGIFQFMEDTWVNGYGRDMRDINSLRAQVEVAGDFFSDLYDDVQFWIGDEALAQLRQMCSGDEDRLVSEIITPLMINAYNAGSRRIGDAVKYYLAARTAEAPLPTGPFAVFHDITVYAEKSDEGSLDRYGEHAREYVPRIYGHLQALYRDGSLT
jgi:hypothetical protein